jgi:hypothetical protein
MDTTRILDGPDWADLFTALDQVPCCLGDLRSPWPQRSDDLLKAARQIETSALSLVPLLVAVRNELFPRPEQWHAPFERYPQPDPTHLLAVREWVLSLGTLKTVPLVRQKRLGSALTQILVAKAAVETYSKRLRPASAPDLVRILAALWLLVAECWKLRPLLAGDGPNE